jgi:hypothetical protein
MKHTNLRTVDIKECGRGYSCIKRNKTRFHIDRLPDFSSPNVKVDRVAPLLRIRDVPGCNLAPQIGYPD